MANGVAYAFDSYEFVKRLTSAGLPVEAAETFAKEQSRLIETVASREDLKEYKSAFKEDFKHLEDRLDAKFAAMDSKNEILKRDMTIRLGNMVLAGAGLVIASFTLILKYLLPH